MNIYSKIGDILDEAFVREDGTYYQYSEKDGVSLDVAIENVFKEASFDLANYDIVTNTLFSCPSVDIGYVSVSWIEDNRLLHIVLEYENR